MRAFFNLSTLGTFMDILQKQKTKFKTEDIDKIVKKFNLSSIVVELLFSRGYTTEEQIEKFLNPKLNDLYNPFLLLQYSKKL